MIKVQRFSNKGRGIVATKKIAKETLIEVSPVASFPPYQRDIIDKTELSPYYFVKHSEYETNKNVCGHIVFGLASLCNHSETPNAYIKWVEDEIGLWVHLIALKLIQMGDEVLIYYTNIDEYSSVCRFI
ncbi:SET domain-containing protein-lysine N-methyltransferase [Baaleninema simplex]|uniref:SET domain-containing protein-lysine N-methyltransferase n=1 Tax=Baaleninema simplex TaxID=2862350 RepID=UPI0003646910|nr:SET domain-containing protein-lysine N-methyltransferase [Baaleninema simplex]